MTQNGSLTASHRQHHRHYDLAPGFVAGVLWLILSSSALALPMTFTDRASFLAALPGPASVLNFDDVDAQTQIAENTPFAGITFTSNLSSPGLIVSDNFDTTSPLNYLGVDDGFSNEFLSGDELTFSFANSVQAFGFSIIGSPDDVFAADFQLTASGSSVFNLGTPEQTLRDGGNVFFLGIIDTAGFSNAQLFSFGDPTDPFFGFNIDDITTVAVPVPATFALLGLGVLAIFGQKRLSDPR